MKKNKILFALLLLFFPIFVFAGSFSISPGSAEIQTGGSTTFTITANNVAGKFIVSSSNSNIATFTIDSSEAVDNKVWIDTNEGKTARVTVTVKAGSQAGKATISVQAEKVGQYDSDTLINEVKNFTVNVVAPHVASDNNNLASLSISGGTLNPAFSAGTTSYSATVDAGSTEVSATAADGAARVSGTGNKSLNYGNNKIEVVCTAENGANKTYVINITRPDNRSTNNFLKSLSVNGATLSPAFNKNTTTYSIPQVDASSITINAAAEDSKAAVIGAGTRNLDYGDNNIKIDVRAENESIKTYTIKVNRKDTRDTTNTLKSLSVEGYSIEPGFNKSRTEYTLTVPPNVSEVRINAERESGKSSFVKNYGPRTVKLDYGENTVLIQVQAENTSSKYRKSYKIKITRTDDRDPDSSLSALSVDRGTFKFDKNTPEYVVNVNYPVEKINVTATATSAKATVEGAGEHELLVGENVIIVTCTAENGSKTSYSIKVNRLPEDATPVEEIDFIKTLTIGGVDLGFAKDTYKYSVEVGADVDKLDINIDYFDGITGEILGNENLVDGSIVKVIAKTKYGASMEYTIVVNKKTDWMSGTNSIYVGGGALIAFAIVFFGIKGLLSKNVAAEGPAEFGTTYIAPDNVVADAAGKGKFVQQQAETVDPPSSERPDDNKFIDAGDGQSSNVPEIDTPDMDEFSNKG